jgi:hypothetical protein
MQTLIPSDRNAYYLLTILMQILIPIDFIYITHSPDVNCHFQ